MRCPPASTRPTTPRAAIARRVHARCVARGYYRVSRESIARECADGKYARRRRSTRRRRSARSARAATPARACVACADRARGRCCRRSSRRSLCDDARVLRGRACARCGSSCGRTRSAVRRRSRGAPRRSSRSSRAATRRCPRRSRGAPSEPREPRPAHVARRLVLVRSRLVLRRCSWRALARPRAALIGASYAARPRSGRDLDAERRSAHACLLLSILVLPSVSDDDIRDLPLRPRSTSRAACSSWPTTPSCSSASERASPSRSSRSRSACRACTSRCSGATGGDPRARGERERAHLGRPRARLLLRRRARRASGLRARALPLPARTAPSASSSPSRSTRCGAIAHAGVPRLLRRARPRRGRGDGELPLPRAVRARAVIAARDDQRWRART